MARAADRGIDLEAKLTQKQSHGRGMMSEETINEFRDVVVLPELEFWRAQGKPLNLNSCGNGDEWWFDINKLLQGKVIGPAGEEFRSQTPGVLQHPQTLNTHHPCKL